MENKRSATRAKIQRIARRTSAFRLPKLVALLAILLVGLTGCGSASPGQHPAIPAPQRARDGHPACRDWVQEAGGEVDWELDAEDEGIVTFKGSVPGSDFFAFKGAGVIDAPIAKVANVLIDASRYQEWVPNFGGMRVIREVSRTEQVIYRHVTTPFIIDDRDFVVKASVRKEEGSGHLLLDFASVEEPGVPEVEGKVRAMVHTSGYRMWPIDGGARTMLIFVVHVDPKGSVPAWIVNLFQTNYAKTEIANLREQVAKPDVVAHPEVAEKMRDFEPACRR